MSSYGALVVNADFLCFYHMYCQMSEGFNRKTLRDYFANSYCAVKETSMPPEMSERWNLRDRRL